METKKPRHNKVYLWKLVLPLLVLANISYFTKDIFGWIVTLGFFLFIPGYLFLSRLKHEVKSNWILANFSLGLSLLILMVSGLALNSLHVFGLSKPLTTLNIFATLDIVSLILLAINRAHLISIPKFNFKTSTEQKLFIAALTLLPLLAVGGAIRLNNGASNILTMILFAVIPILFILLVWRYKKLSSLFPYAIFMFALAVLYSTSLRGWFITGHDIQHEFKVFQATSLHGYWTMSGDKGDPYNACLSITILPTIIAKITTIYAPYVFKVVFQTFFAFGLLPVYFLIKRLRDARTALIGAFVFISFPTFFDDMPFLNRQETAFIFFGLLVLVTFMKMAYKTKTILTTLFLLGLILSHYSSGYTALLLLLLGAAIYHLLQYKKKEDNQKLRLPALRLSIIFAALLFTFLWNVQITASASNLKNSIDQTLSGLVSHSSERSGFVQYSLLSNGGSNQTPSQQIVSYAGKQANQVQYINWPNLPITRLGNFISHFTDVTSINYTIHSFDAKIFQVLLLLGVILLLVRRNKSTQAELYLCALSISSAVMLILFTLLPSISLDYSPTRLFQQTLIITALPIVMAAEFLLGFLKQYKIYFVAIFFALLFLDLSGFIPQSIGSYLPQLSLNNTGEFYDFFYTHKSDIVSSDWLAANRDTKTPIFMDITTSSVSFLPFPIHDDVIQSGDNGYLYLEYANTQNNIYRVRINGNLWEYSDPSLTTNRNLIYSNQNDEIFGKGLNKN